MSAAVIVFVVVAVVLVAIIAMANLQLDNKDISAVQMAEAGNLSPKVFDEGISNVPTKYRGTDADRRDMTVLGKKQVLRVGSPFPGCCLGDMLTVSPAQLQLHHHAGLRLHLRGKLGRNPHVRPSET